jgi:cellulose synthase/poly-beta-1,6-N-acetylglucosamine synthase-like glycosyltransferase
MSASNEYGINRLQRWLGLLAGIVVAMPAQAAAWGAGQGAGAGSGAGVWLGSEGGAFAGWLGSAGAWGLLGALGAVLLLLSLFALRHGVLLLSRLFGTQRQPFANVVSVDWPPVTVLLLAANHATSIEACLQGLLHADYPSQRLRVVAITDHASDGTPALIDALAQQHPGRVSALHRNDPADFGAGATASLQAATALVDTDFVIVLDPTHQPAQGMVRRLMAPFCDPEVGAVTGRLVGRTDPRFAGGVAYGFPGAGLAARLTELERSGASQVGQRASANLGLAPQQTGLWGAVRLKALRAAGGWPQEPMGADVALHAALRRAGWLTLYQPNAELFDEPVPSWAAREQQVQEVAHGQQAALRQHLGARAHTGLAARLDAVLRLRSHWAAPLLLLAWGLTLLAYFVVAPEITAAALVLLMLLSFSVMSNSAAFFEQAGAALLDRSRLHVRLLPLGLVGFVGQALASLRGIAGLGLAPHTFPDDPALFNPNEPPALEPLQPYPKFEPALQHPLPLTPIGAPFPAPSAPPPSPPSASGPERQP